MLITESSERVSAGVRHVGATETALSAILGSVESPGDVVADIAQAGREQGRASEEIAASVQQLDQITQQNAALADRSAKSADQLSVEIGGLDELISAFRTEQRCGVRIAA